MRVSFVRRCSREAGFKLVELMIAVAVFVIGGGVAYPLLIGDLALYVRNFSLNKSDNSLRYSLQRLKKDIDMAIEPPWLANYSVSGAAGVLTPQASATSAQGILLWVNLGPSYDLQPTSATNSSVPVTGTMTLNRRVNTVGPTDPFPSSPMPQIGDRLIIQSPGVYSTGMPETVTMNGASILKPGRRINFVNNQITNPVSDNNASSITIKVDNAASLPTTITGPQSVYIVREMAYVVKTINDGSGNPIERQLLCYPTTNDMTKSVLLIRDVDPTPMEIDPNTGAVIQPFNYYGAGGRGLQSPLSLNLPVRAIDYANAITTRQAAVSSEFNVYLRSSPQMGGKVRLD